MINHKPRKNDEKKEGWAQMLQAGEERPIAPEPDTGSNAFNQGQPFFLEIF